MIRRLFALLPLFFTLAITACSAADVPSLDVLSVKENYPRALVVAEEWADDPQLIEVQGTIRTSYQGGANEALLVFVFEAKTKNGSNLKVTCSIDVCNAFQQGTEYPFLPRIKAYSELEGIPIVPDNLALDSTDAATLGANLGGWHCATQQNWSGGLDLHMNEQQRLVWEVVFDCPLYGSTAYGFDALTSELIDSDRHKDYRLLVP